jgi:6-phosphogluconolactonase/glucosamine-6-phosphate isomerase/deaminase
MLFEKFSSADQLTSALADLLAAEFARTSAQPQLVMLAGGRTPLAAYAQIAARGIAADTNLHLCLSDERHVPVTSPDSNAGQLADLVRVLQLPPERVLFPDTALPLAASVRGWGKQLGGFLQRGGKLSLGVLGLGADGHTASLFSLDDVERSRGLLTLAVTHPNGSQRISLSAELLAKFARLVIVTAGAEKQPMVERLRTAPLTIPAGAATLRAPCVECWFAD